MTREEWDKLTDDQKWEYVVSLEEQLSGEGEFDYKFVVHEIEAASQQAQKDRDASIKKARLFWEQHEKGHPRNEKGEWE